jgi:very-short-patch-repair endonuclease
MGEDQLARNTQNGAISWDQLRQLGLTPGAIQARVARGTLIHIFYRAYTLADPALLPLAREAAALLSLGDAVISHRSAAAIWGIAEPGPGAIDVTLVRRQVRPRPGVRLHRVSRLDPRDIRTRHNLRLTSPARTLIDFATQASGEELDQAFGEARAKRLLSDAGLKAALDRAPKNHPGAAIIRRRLHHDPGSTYTRSGAERLVRRLMETAELPQPLVNAKVNGFTVDFLWPDARLILEVDGHGTHGHRLAFERDRRRDQIQAAAGYTVIRVTWRQLVNEPLAVLARIAQALALRAA